MAHDRMALHGALETLISGPAEEGWLEAAQQILEFALTIPESSATFRSFEMVQEEDASVRGYSPGVGQVTMSDRSGSMQERFGPVCERVGAYKLWRQRGQPYVTIRHYRLDAPHIDLTKVDSFTEYWLFYGGASPQAVLLGETLWLRRPLRWWMRLFVGAASLLGRLRHSLNTLLHGGTVEYYSAPFCFGVQSCTVLRSIVTEPGFRVGDDLIRHIRNARS